MSAFSAAITSSIIPLHPVRPPRSCDIYSWQTGRHGRTTYQHCTKRYFSTLRPTSTACIRSSAGYHRHFALRHVSLQPWAQLLVLGIKRIEGRGWTSLYRGKLWIHATAQIPTAKTVQVSTSGERRSSCWDALVGHLQPYTAQLYLQELKDFFREVHGEHKISFPEQLPVSALVGCVTVADVLTVRPCPPSRVSSRALLTLAALVHSTLLRSWLASSPCQACCMLHACAVLGGQTAAGTR